MKNSRLCPLWGALEPKRDIRFAAKCWVYSLVLPWKVWSEVVHGLRPRTRFYKFSSVGADIPLYLFLLKKMFVIKCYYHQFILRWVHCKEVVIVCRVKVFTWRYHGMKVELIIIMRFIYVVLMQAVLIFNWINQYYFLYLNRYIINCQL